MSLHEGGGEGGDGVKAVDEAQGGAHQGVEGLAKHLVGHPGGPKGDAPDVCVWILQCSPCSSCNKCTALRMPIITDALITLIKIALPSLCTHSKGRMCRTSASEPDLVLSSHQAESFS